MKIEKIRNKIIKTYNKMDKLSNKMYNKCFIFEPVNNLQVLNYKESYNTEMTITICNTIDNGLKLIDEILRTTQAYSTSSDEVNYIKNNVHNNKITFIYLMCCLYTKDVSFYDEKMDILIDEMINLLHLLERSL